MVVLLIAALHAVFPIAGVLLGGRAGLCLGTLAGIGVAVCIGVTAYTFPDLIGVAVGFAIGRAIASGR